MSIFDDESPRGMRLDESVRRAIMIDDATRRSLAASFDVGRQVIDMAEHRALLSNAVRMREQLDRMQIDKIFTQYRLAFDENSYLRTAIENLRNVETLKNINGIANLKQLALGLGAPSLQMRDQIASVAAHYKNNFILPDAGAIAKLKEQALAVKDFHLSASNAMKAIEAMRSPWLDTRRALELGARLGRDSIYWGRRHQYTIRSDLHDDPTATVG